jgi:hypothetical protein
VELHEWLLFFHILGSIIWVGGVIVQNAVMARASRAPDRTTVLRLAAELEWALWVPVELTDAVGAVEVPPPTRASSDHRYLTGVEATRVGIKVASADRIVGTM